MSDLFSISLTHFVVVSFLLLAAGISTMLTKRNAIGILIGVELVLNAAAINFVAFNYYRWPATIPTQGVVVVPNPGRPDMVQIATRAPLIDGQMFAIFIIVLAAAEAAIALAIFLNFYNNFSSIDVERADQLKG